MKPIIMSTEDVRSILDGRKTMMRIPVKPQPTYWDDGERLYGKDNIVGPEFYNPIRIDKDGEEYPGKEVYGIYSDNGEYGCKAPYKPGDVLWVRETWKPQDYSFVDNVMSCQIIFKAGGSDNLNPRVFWNHGDDTVFESCGAWHPSINMPREAARLFLRVKDVRVERVQDISDDDSLAEGIPDDLGFPMDKVYCPRCNGEGLIGSLNGRSLGYQEVDCPQCQTAKQRFANLWNARNAKRGYGWGSNPFVWVISFERLE